jgi:predicted ribosome quality control (RQC) complex YloA/Tae2 family protein
MPFDGFVLAAVKKELSNTIIGFKIDKIHQPFKEEIHLILSKAGSKTRLLLSADSGMSRIHLTGQSPENPSSPPVFCMVMRKHLEGGRIKEICQLGYDRTLILKIDTRDELGRSSEKHIVCEIMGKHSNIILLDPSSGIILDGIKRYSHALSRYREVLPGQPYIPAPSQEKSNPLDLTEDDFINLIMNNNLNSKIWEIIQRKFEGLSPLLAKEIAWRSGLDIDTPLNLLGHYDLISVYRTLRDIFLLAEAGDFKPTIIYDNKIPKDFASFPIYHLQSFQQSGNEMNQVLENYYSQRLNILKKESLKHSIISLVKKEINRLNRKLAAQLDDLNSASNAKKYRHYGEIIKANIHKLKKGDSSVLLDDFFTEGCPKVKIRLDPQLTPVENAQKLFQKYNKAKKVLENATAQAEATRSELDYLSGVENSAEMADTLEELNQIKIEMIEQGYIKPAGSKRSNIKQQEKPVPPVFISSDNFTILAGKNNRQNDYLTMKLAQPNDIWLHARGIPGSHVLIRTENKEVPASTIEQAASLAAYFSQARISTKVPVDYTLRKYVNKPKGAKPGFVIYKNFKTVIANPDPSIVEKLRQGS